MHSQLALVVVVICLVAVFTAGAIARILLRHRRRARALTDTARSLGFSCEPNGRPLLDEGLSEVPVFCFALLQQGELRNLLRGPLDSHRVAICDYHYWSGTTGGTRSEHHQTVFCFEVQRERIPDFVLRPRESMVAGQLASIGVKLAEGPQSLMKSTMDGARSRLLDAVLAGADSSGVDFSAHPKFAGYFRVHATDGAAARNTFYSGVLNFFARLQKPFPSVEKAGSWFVVYKANVLVKPAELTGALQEAREILAQFEH